MTELFERFEGNPVIVPADVSPVTNAVFNPGATAFEGGTLLLLRVEDRTGLSRLVVATSRDGFTGWSIDPERGIAPDPDRFEERWGVEDPRITQIDGVFYVVYTGYSEGGPLVCLATTQDFVTFERHGVLMSPEDKDAALFPQTFDGRWALLHRPDTGDGRARSPRVAVVEPRPPLLGRRQDRPAGPPRRLVGREQGGRGPPPMRTDRGWLLCYHGVRTTASGALYRAGLALLDLDDPAVVLARTDEWVFGPTAPYERSGDVPGVVFPSGWVLDPDGDSVRIYYGGADSVVGVATTSLIGMLHALEV